MNQPIKRSVTEDAPKGLVCRNCGCRHFEVIYTRPRPGERIVRRRECRHCGRRITTYEQAVGTRP